AVMKANSTPAIAGFLISTCAAAFATGSSVPTPEAFLSLAANHDSTVGLSISNSGNQVWAIQSSTNLTNWSEIETLKIHTGAFALPSAATANPMHFFRAAYDPTRQDIFSTVATALFLPATPFNYAAPVLPASFSVQPILAQDNMPANNVTTDSG